VSRTAEGDLLSNWGDMLGVSRTYYGHNACLYWSIKNWRVKGALI
jgi:hypothetical protein